MLVAYVDDDRVCDAERVLEEACSQFMSRFASATSTSTLSAALSISQCPQLTLTLSANARST